jgi:hypothetical protein
MTVTVVEKKKSPSKGKKKGTPKTGKTKSKKSSSSVKKGKISSIPKKKSITKVKKKKSPSAKTKRTISTKKKITKKSKPQSIKTKKRGKKTKKQILSPAKQETTSQKTFHPIEKPTPVILEYENMTYSELEALIQSGKMPNFESMKGYLYRGLNLGKLAKFFNIRKFIKGFYRDFKYQESGNFHFGYNISAKQNVKKNEWRMKEKKIPIQSGLFNLGPNRFGFYRVYPVNNDEKDNKYPNALLLNYGCRLNSLLNPIRLLRDYLVRLIPDSDNLLLGKAYFKIGPFRLFVGFFILEKMGKSNYSGKT